GRVARAIWCGHHLDLRPVCTYIAEPSRRHSVYIAWYRERGREASLPGRADPLSHRRALTLANAVDQRLEAEATPFFEDVRVVRNDEAPVHRQRRHRRKDLAGHHAGQLFALGLAQDRLEPM